MQLKDQEEIMVHDDVAYSGLYGVSNPDGVYAYFTTEEMSYNFAQVVAITEKRLRNLLQEIELDKNDETSYNELEVIYGEIRKLKL
jgi:hypothetical protein